MMESMDGISIYPEELSEFWCVAGVKTQIFEETRSGGSFETLTSVKATALKRTFCLSRDSNDTLLYTIKLLFLKKFSLHCSRKTSARFTTPSKKLTSQNNRFWLTICLCVYINIA